MADRYFEDFSWQLSLSANFNMLLAGAFKRVGPLQCLNVYAVEFESSTSNLYIVTEDISNLDRTLPVMLYAERISTHVLPIVNPGRWICSQFPRTDTSLCSDHFSSFRANISTWNPFGYEVNYCLTIAHPADCMDFSTSTVERQSAIWPFGYVSVGIVNLVQAIVCILFLRVKETTLLTQDDAILSFLEDPHSITQSMYLLEKTDVTRFKARKKTQVESRSRKWLSSHKALRC
jgi:hypothetical protein